MSWACELSTDAERDLKRVPKETQRRVAVALAQLSQNPFHGGVKPLKGSEWKGVYRKRVGSYRLLFVAEHKSKTITVIAILLRSEKTYRYRS